MLFRSSAKAVSLQSPFPTGCPGVLKPPYTPKPQLQIGFRVTGLAVGSGDPAEIKGGQNKKQGKAAAIQQSEGGEAKIKSEVTSKPNKADEDNTASVVTMNKRSMAIPQLKRLMAFCAPSRI